MNSTRKNSKYKTHYSLKFIALILVFYVVSKRWDQFKAESDAGEDSSVWSHKSETFEKEYTCSSKGISINGECFGPKTEKIRNFDPCNPKGEKEIFNSWSDFHGRKFVKSSTLGLLERHRFDCLVVPKLMKMVLDDRLEATNDIDFASLGSDSVNHFTVPFLKPVRTLIFGPHGELGKMQVVGDLFLKSGKYPLDYIQADYSPEICNRTGAYRVNAMKMPFPNNFFSVVFFSHISEHVPDIETVFREIYRVMEPGGFALLSAPINSKLESTIEDDSCTTIECRKRKFGQFDHVRIIGNDFFPLMDRVFDVAIYGTYHSFYEKKMPFLKDLFSNPEFHRNDSQMFSFGFKGRDREELEFIF